MIDDNLSRHTWKTKNNEGTLTEAEAAELQALVNAYNARTFEKAKALLELQRRGADTGDNPRYSEVL